MLTKIQKLIVITGLIFISKAIVIGQYAPLKNVEMRGIMWPTSAAENCSGSTNPPGCPTYNVTGMNWYMSGVESTPYTFAYSTLGWDPFVLSNRDYAMVYEGNIEVRDPDGAICFNSPVINITGHGTVSMSFSVTRPGSGTTYNWVNFNYRVNGGATVSSGNLTGGTGVTSTWNPTASGNTLELWACMSATGNNDVYNLVLMNTNLGAPLPVRWSGLFASLDRDKKVHISWSTATEINNDYFEVERSMNDLRYESIGIIKGAGNSSDTKQYSFIDEKAVPGNTYYYRVKQVDYDGQTDYSIPLKVDIESSIFALRISPNPVKDFLKIDLDGLPDRPLELYVYSIQGQLMLTKVLDSTQTSIELDISQIPPGAYFLSSNDSEIKRIKIIKIDP